MSVFKPELGKALWLSSLVGSKLDSALKSDIRNVIKQDAGDNKRGGHFQVPFWSDAKGYIFNDTDLVAATTQRVARDKRKRDLYPRYTKGFLQWWRDVRRTTNAPVAEYQRGLVGEFQIPGSAAVIKVHNLIGISSGERLRKIVAPYFKEKPSLLNQQASWGLAIMNHALPGMDPSTLSILDVIRGREFNFANTATNQAELENFSEVYRSILARWQEIRADYE